MDTSQQQRPGGPRVADTARPRTRGTDRSLTRRAELIAIGRKLFADTSYDALSMDDIARQAHVAKGLIYYYFESKRGYYLAIIEDAVAGLVARAGSDTDLPGRTRLERTIDGYLRYAEHNQAAYRTIISGGVGFDSEVHALLGGVREAIVDTIAEGAYGRRDIPRVARLALLGWQWSVEGVTLDWIDRADPSRDEVRELLVRLLGSTLRTIEELEPSCPAPPPPVTDGPAPPVPGARTG
ncbi:TetR/AcrR family transcriptional regulator [Streptomyces sp. NPDC127068]|uniref:TetR/AcrR family transcriptional regulator n=1 Tax=Streptomyces sp. NPDC127068 TaxID=3347127 RepID=UPI003649C938